MDRSYCIFGDSITQASYVEYSWVNLLKKFLEEKYINDFVNVYNLGIGGNTTADILQRLVNEAPVRKPTSYIFQVGVNDSGYFWTLDKPIVSETEFKTNLEKIIFVAKENTIDITFLGLTIGDESILKPLPQSSKGNSYTKERTKAYNKVLKEMCELNKCKYIPLINILQLEDFSDGLHPNEEGHLKIFESIKSYF